METTGGIFQNLEIVKNIIKGAQSTEQSSDWHSYTELQAVQFNQENGDLTEFNCPICKNKGTIAVVLNDSVIYKKCDCMIQRSNLKKIERSGLKQLLNRYTFDNYITREKWQATAKNKALSFCENHQENWLYIGGQVGSGKTHLCTAVVNEFLKLNLDSKYMLWRDEIVPLKANVNNEDAYSSLINPLKRAKVLYIDDFFKTERGKAPTTADINIAFELLNYRYNNTDLITIISSEMYLDDLIDIDEAVGSRLYQRTKKYCIIVEYDKTRNYRFRS